MTKTERHTALRETLIVLGQAAVAQHGLAGLKARDLSRQAGCALGAIYLVFPDLDALILAINGRTLAAIDAALCASLDPNAKAPPDTSPAQQLVSLSCAYLNYALAHPRLWAAIFSHTLPGDRRLPEAYQAHQARLFAYVEAPLAALCPRMLPAHVALASRTLFSAVHGIVLLGVDQKLRPMSEQDLRDELSGFVGTVARGFQVRKIRLLSSNNSKGSRSGEDVSS